MSLPPPGCAERWGSIGGTRRKIVGNHNPHARPEWAKSVIGIVTFMSGTSSASGTKMYFPRMST